jgi:hypothetical protein
MPYFCKYCARPDIAQIFEELKRGIPRTSVVSKYGLDSDKDYGPLGKCFHDHRPHDHAFEVDQSIKRNSKMLTAELRKAAPYRATIKYLEQRLQALRKEQRELAVLAKQEHPVDEKGETPLTVEALDEIIRKAMPYCTDGHMPYAKVQYILEYQMSREVRERTSEDILVLLAAKGYEVNSFGKFKRTEFLPERRAIQ